MTGAATVLLGVAIAAAVTDWIAVATSRRRLEYAAKPAVMVALIALALALRPVNPTERAFFVVALLLGLLSDVFLMLPRDMFVAGLAAALVEHLAYISGFRTRDLHLGMLLVAAAVALASAALIYPPIQRSLLHHGHQRLVAPVIAYLVVFVLMVASAGGSGSLIALAGALLFFYSDAILAWNRFVNPLPQGRIVNIVPYHLGQALLVVSLLT